MPGMQTELHAVMSHPGDYEGFSANYSGAGFSDMHFRFLAMNEADFGHWVETIKAGGGNLGREDYLALARPSEREPVRRYAAVAPGLYDAILNLCVNPDKMCLRDMMKVDAKGGLGMASVYNVGRLAYDKPAGDDGEAPQPGLAYVLALCAADPGRLWSQAPRTSQVSDAATPRPTANN
jgi:cytochrome o ubiquinol oxidase subunit 2